MGDAVGATRTTWNVPEQAVNSTTLPYAICDVFHRCRHSVIKSVTSRASACVAHMCVYPYLCIRSIKIVARMSCPNSEMSTCVDGHDEMRTR